VSHIQGLPGEGDPGECQVCGVAFLEDLIAEENILTTEVPGMTCEIALHRSCRAKLNVKTWQDLPEGPLRRAFAAVEASSTTDTGE